MRRRIKLLFIFSLCALFTSIACFTGCSLVNTNKGKPSICKHERKNELLAVESNCTSSGKSYGLVCADCGIVIVKQISIGIKHKLVHLKGIKATCTTDGLTEGCYCELCDYEEPQETILAEGHIRDENGICMVCSDMPDIPKETFEELNVNDVVGGKFIRFYYENFINKRLLLCLENDESYATIPYKGVAISIYEENGELNAKISCSGDRYGSSDSNIGYELGEDDSGKYLDFQVFTGLFSYTDYNGNVKSLSISDSTKLLAIYDSDGNYYSSLSSYLYLSE